MYRCICEIVTWGRKSFNQESRPTTVATPVDAIK